MAEIEGRILELKRAVAVIENIGDGKRWRVEFTYINVDSEAPLPQPPASETSPHAWNIGDTVCFRDRDNREIVGQIVKLNPKRAKVLTETTTWTVGYEWLSQIVDAEASVSRAPRLLSADVDN